MELTLKLLTGSGAGKEIKVPRSKFLIGRADDCHLRPYSDMVSRHHCVLLIEEGFCAVRDFGSKNGTLVNEERVVGQRELKNGDRMKIGVLEFEVELTSSVGGRKRPKVRDVKDVAQRTAGTSAEKTDDDNISGWLSEGHGVRETRRVGVAKKQPPHETPALKSPTHDTTFLNTPTDETTMVKLVKAGQAKEILQAESKQPLRGVETAKRLFGGRFVAMPKNAPKSSHEAADEALDQLPPLQRRIVELRMQGYQVHEIAEEHRTASLHLATTSEVRTDVRTLAKVGEATGSVPRVHQLIHEPSRAGSANSVIAVE
jgi:pSer/pThr/pTyr-binding forkhead associated (FHA) protein